jgi:hypothetical protein
MIECTHKASTGWKNNVRQKAEIGRFREFQHSTPELGQASSVPQPPPKAHGTGQAFGGQGPPVGDMLVAGGLCRCTIQRHGASPGPGKAPRLLRVPPTGSETPARTPTGSRMRAPAKGQAFGGPAQDRRLGVRGRRSVTCSSPGDFADAPSSGVVRPTVQAKHPDSCACHRPAPRIQRVRRSGTECGHGPRPDRSGYCRAPTGDGPRNLTRRH